MIGYRFLSAAEEEMSRAAEFYETATIDVTAPVDRHRLSGAQGLLLPRG